SSVEEEIRKCRHLIITRHLRSYALFDITKGHPREQDSARGTALRSRLLEVIANEKIFLSVAQEPGGTGSPRMLWQSAREGDSSTHACWPALSTIAVIMSSSCLYFV